MAAIVVLLADVGAAGETKPLNLETASGTHRYDVEVADTDAERARGLMFRRSLPKTGGMIFLHREPQEISMWMSNTYIPLDMIFIAADGTVHRVETNTEPFSKEIIRSGGPVTAVLEINAGEADRIGLMPGDRVLFEGLGVVP